jgi:hypothetical protein
MSAMPGTLCSRDIGDALQHVIASAAFRSAPRLAAFLRFVVEMALAGRSDRIKSYTIGAEALGRGEGFDPQTDPIVRVEAGRLRRALARYYAGEGFDDPIIIELPRGRYVPHFCQRPAVRAPAAIEAEAIVVALERLIEAHRLQAEAMEAEVAVARRMLKGMAAGASGAISTAGPARGPLPSETRTRSRCRHCPDRPI